MLGPPLPVSPFADPLEPIASPNNLSNGSWVGPVRMVCSSSRFWDSISAMHASCGSMSGRKANGSRESGDRASSCTSSSSSESSSATAPPLAVKGEAPVGALSGCALRFGSLARAGGPTSWSSRATPDWLKPRRAPSASKRLDERICAICGPPRGGTDGKASLEVAPPPIPLGPPDLPPASGRAAWALRRGGSEEPPAPWGPSTPDPAVA